VCTPNRYHAPLTIAALEAGKHVMCEKPLAPTPGEVRDMIRARDRAQRLLMTAQSLRFEPPARALRDEVATGVLGPVYHARCWALRRGGVPARPGFVQRRHSGGGPCIDIGVHLLDLALWLMGNPQPVSVSGVARADLSAQPGAFSAWGPAPIPPSYDVEDFAAGFVRFADGATLILETSWLLHGEDRSELWLYGRAGGCHWPSLQVTEADAATRQHYQRRLRLTAGTRGGHAQECLDFARAVATGGPSPVPAEQSLQVMQILDGIYRSQAQGGEVSID
jgi:predicted dehydrogenase